MSSKQKLMVVIGTRPEAIKLAPVVDAIRRSDWAECELVLTGQHKELLLPLIERFGLQVDHNLNVMRENQTLSHVTARILQSMDDLLVQSQPAAVIGQGDTASVLAGSMASFFRRIPFAHVEAGLRTGNIDLPFPEELNRVLTSRMTRWHFAPTGMAQDNLLREGFDPASIWVTGNTVIDALHMMLSQSDVALPSRPGRPFVLITAHRRENLGEPMQHICAAILQLAQLHPGMDFIYPVHPNPGVRQIVHRALQGQSNVLLVEPCDYPVFCQLMSRARLILSDSGGVQEEAPALGKPVLVLREETERPEAVALGCNLLVGTDTSRIVDAAQTLLLDRTVYDRMAHAGSPYGDGQASQRILEVLRQTLIT
ncbi:non-hydrolyzing UDP-N-acetylglucosamine 2-epimerase [Limnohabitans radicicola]|uniref:UDP-N-acetylglucosamine 2-epimerase (non-hydrolyzing) n=1 Tax=Limnohabitans radicicola TaxID=2771427 RepID=A0A927FE52_9BURK|nr:UDP-N-acetylglucosamine 2-epimerase (non-hydrolyzing) [Limnohabitans radicicola]MBD8049725.1 UDP-N-acetylglucosamine 2-epimerase (non-hydrolyzing) [Limnohabitans radicicola]